VSDPEATADVRRVRVGHEEIEIPSILPVLPVRNVVVFPGVAAAPLTVGRTRSLAALEDAGPDGLLVVATQIDPATDDPSLADLHPVACIARLARIIETPGLERHAIVVGAVRTRMTRVAAIEPGLRVYVEPIPEPVDDRPELAAAHRSAVSLAHAVIDAREDLPDEWKGFVSSLPYPGLLADLIASTLPLSLEERVALLSQADPGQRLERIATHLERELTIAEAQMSLRDERETAGIEPRRRERVLRRQMREIQAELGEADAGARETDELREKIDAAELPEEAHAQAERELRRLIALPQHAPDRHLIRTYLDWLVDLPWSVETEDIVDLKRSREVLDADHHDLDKVKERIIEYLAVRKMAPNAKAPILCFVGPPGVGKTSLGRSIARAMGRKFTRASLGGVRDEAEIRGHRRTYVGAMPGRILQSLRRAGSRNPVFLLDEVDKLGADFRGDPSSALLEVLDPEQNHTFSDHYVEVAFDLSKVLFITTANTLATIPPALLDRMEVIELSGYTDADKRVIARRYLIPKQIEAHGLSEKIIRLEDEAIDVVVHEYTREAGVRNLDRYVAGLMRKAARRIAEGRSHGHDESVVIDDDFVRTALGPPPHLPETAERTEMAGVVVGLAATSHGGDILFIEATPLVGGEGVRLRLTGQLGDVMKESAETALSWVRSNGASLVGEAPALRNGEIHLHVPAGAVPKDGPSAGVTLVTALVSALSGRRARGDVAMTGEISLRGRVLPVGGVKDKVLAASRAGIRTVILPRRNEKDLVDVPDDVRESLDLRLVDTIEEVLELALEPGTAPA
jgi:ATP-dependent Lon protease